MGSLVKIAALAAAQLAGPAVTYNIGRSRDPLDFDLGLRRRSRGKGKGIKRGKGIQAKPKKRPNRLIISKRVRRKHRRAA